MADEKRTKNRFNIIDFVIIAAVLAVIFGVFLRSDIAKKISTKTASENIEYEFIVNSIRKSSEQYFYEGEVIYSQSTGEKVGVITKVVEVRPAEAYIELSDGEIVKTYIPERIDVVCRAEIDGKYEEGEGYFMHGTTFIASGKEIYSRTKNLSFYVYH